MNAHIIEKQKHNKKQKTQRKNGISSDSNLLFSHHSQISISAAFFTRQNS
jgi:hypothetical protein